MRIATEFSKSLLLTIACTLVGSIAWAQPPNEDLFGVSTREQTYPILGKGADTSLAVGMTISSYPPETTLSSVREKLSGLAEVDRLKVPEYLLLRELDLVATGEKEAIVDLYFGEASKNFARNERWRDMEYSTSFAREKVDHYLLQTKAYFGPFVRIRYKPIVKEGISIGGVVVMREIEGTYYFSEELGKEHIFHIAAEAYPHWEKSADRNNTGDLIGFKQVSIFCEGVPGVSVVKSTPVHVYCKFEPVWEQAFPDVEVKNGIESKLSLLLEGYKATSPEKIAQAWAPSQRASVQKSLESDPVALKKNAAMFEASSQIKPIYLARSGPELLVYAVDCGSSIANGAPHVFRFEKEGGEYFLGENVRLSTPFPAAILRSKEMIATVSGWIQASNVPDLGNNEQAAGGESTSPSPVDRGNVAVGENAVDGTAVVAGNLSDMRDAEHVSVPKEAASVQNSELSSSLSAVPSHAKRWDLIACGAVTAGILLAYALYRLSAKSN